MYYFKKVHYRAKQVIQPIPIYKKHKKKHGIMSSTTVKKDKKETR